MEANSTIRNRLMKRRITIVTNASGAFATTTQIEGDVIKLFYDRNSALDTAADLTIKDNDTTENVWVQNDITANKVIYPRVLVQFTSGADIATTYTPISSHTLSISLVSGGDTKTGYLTVFYR